MENGSRTEQIELGIVSDAKVGDWVLYATDRAVRRIDEIEAREIIELLEDNYQPVDIKALPLKYKRIIYKIRTEGQKNRKTEELKKNEIENFRTNSNKKNDKLSTTGYSILTNSDLEYLLNLKGSNNLEALYSEANVMRKDRLEDFVCIHGIIEFSNFCKNNCLYCGIRADAKINRYRMSEVEIFRAAKFAVEQEGYKLIVLQSGEDYSYSDNDLIKIIRKIKEHLRVFIFISMGERSKRFYRAAFEGGASGSLFRFETSNPKLYRKMHPGHSLDERLRSLRDQIEIGYYIASGGLIGLPGQTISDLADDLLLVRKLGIPMLSAGPWIESAQSPLSKIKDQKSKIKNIEGDFDQSSDLLPTDYSLLSNDDRLRLTLNYIAAARLLMPEIKIPVTTALETLDPASGRHKGLLAGANALMFNITPEKYRADYNLYDHKYIEREKVWQKYGLFKGEESYEMLEERLQI